MRKHGSGLKESPGTKAWILTKEAEVSTILRIVLTHFIDPTIALLYTMFIKCIIHILLLNTLFIWMDLAVSRKKTICYGLCIMLLETIPIVIVNLIIPIPLTARVWVYKSCMYTNPLYFLLYYYIVKHGFHFSPTRSLVIIRYQIIINYMATTFFLFLNDLLCRIFNIRTEPDKYFPPDYLSYLITLGICFIIWYRLKSALKGSKKHLIFPPKYSIKKNRKQLIKILSHAFSIFAVLLFFRFYWVNEISTPLTAASGFIYFLLLAGMLLYLLDTNYRLRNQLLNWEMQATGAYISSLLHTNQEFRAIKHDFYNVLQGYGGYLAIQDYEGLVRYHKKLFATTKKAGDFLSIIEVLRSRIAVYSLLEAMADKAQKAGITFSFHQLCEVTDIVLDDFDLCRILGIILDNAIEAAQYSEEKQIAVSFERKDENTTILVVSNTTKSDVDTDIIFKEGYTTKENHSGIGLPQVVHILNTYEHCFLRVNYHDRQFTLFLILNSART